MAGSRNLVLPAPEGPASKLVSWRGRIWSIRYSWSDIVPFLTSLGNGRALVRVTPPSPRNCHTGVDRPTILAVPALSSPKTLTETPFPARKCYSKETLDKPFRSAYGKARI